MRPLPSVDEINEILVQSFPQLEKDGLTCEEIGEDYAIARWKYQPEALRPGGYIPGPAQFGLADVTLWLALFGAVGVEVMAVTSEMSIRFVRPAIGGDMLARATIQSVSAKRVVGTIELWIDGIPDKLVAIAQGTYVRPVTS